MKGKDMMVNEKQKRNEKEDEQERGADEAPENEFIENNRWV